jgi:DNA-binding transcriptional LysR family regulator
VELRAAEAALAAGPEVTGSLRVGIPLREGPQTMSRALTEVRRRFPDLEIRLSAVTDETGADAVRRDQVDMVIVSRYGKVTTAPGPGLREWVLGRDPLRLCVPTDHRLADEEACDMATLAADRWILIPGTTLGRLVTSMCVTAGFQPRIAATVNDVGTALGLVGIGWGVTIAPELTPAGAGQAAHRGRRRRAGERPDRPRRRAHLPGHGRDDLRGPRGQRQELTAAVAGKSGARRRSGLLVLALPVAQRPSGARGCLDAAIGAAPTVPSAARASPPARPATRRERGGRNRLE